MRFDSLMLFAAGVTGAVLGLAVLASGVHGVAAVLCGFVLVIAAMCIYTAWRFWTDSPLNRYRERRRMAVAAIARRGQSPLV